MNVVSVHLEAYSGIRGHMAQFALILAEATRWSKAGVPHVIGGDLNTHSHGLARLLPHFANDDLRWSLPLGQHEAEYFDAHVIAPSHLRDPFHKRRDTTSHTGAEWLYAGKLDWLLHSTDCTVAQRFMGGADASDHKFVAADLRLPATAPANPPLTAGAAL